MSVDRTEVSEKGDGLERGYSTVLDVRILYVFIPMLVTYNECMEYVLPLISYFVTYSYFVFNMVTNVQILYYVSFNVQILQ